MNILQNQGKSTILGIFSGIDPVTNEIMSPEKIIELAGRTCYESQDKITRDSASKFLEKILKSGHLSVIEHSYMTVRFENISRSFTHEAVRHRLCAFSQRSTRYVDEMNFNIIMPSHRNMSNKVILDDGRVITVTEYCELIEQMYRGLRSIGWAPEDARQCLPIGIETELVVSTNFREWMHIFSLRTSKAAHWEIRRVMIDLLGKVQLLIPKIFDEFKVVGTDKNDVPYCEIINKDKERIKELEEQVKELKIKMEYLKGKTGLCNGGENNG